jgi:hypothetical protein
LTPWALPGGLRGKPASGLSRALRRRFKTDQNNQPIGALTFSNVDRDGVDEDDGRARPAL